MKITQEQINVLIRSNFIDKLLKKDKKIIKNHNFSNCDLSCLDLGEITFLNCSFNNCNLSNCNLRKTIIKKQKLNGADFSGADMREADLSESELQNADFTNSNLWKITIIDGDMSWCNLNGAILKCANLLKSDLTDTILEGLVI